MADKYRSSSVGSEASSADASAASPDRAIRAMIAGGGGGGGGGGISAVRQMRDHKVPDLLNELVLHLTQTKPEDPIAAMLTLLEAKQQQSNSNAPLFSVVATDAHQNNQNNHARRSPSVGAQSAVLNASGGTSKHDASTTDIAVDMATEGVGGPITQHGIPPLALTGSTALAATAVGSPIRNLARGGGGGVTSPSAAAPDGTDPSFAASQCVTNGVVLDKGLVQQAEVQGEEVRRLLAALEAESNKQMSILGINQQQAREKERQLLAVGVGVTTSTSVSLLGPSPPSMQQQDGGGKGSSTNKGSPLLGLGALSAVSTLTPSLLAAANQQRALIASLGVIGRQNEEVVRAMAAMGRASDEAYNGCLVRPIMGGGADAAVGGGARNVRGGLNNHDNTLMMMSGAEGDDSPLNASAVGPSSVGVVGGGGGARVRIGGVGAGGLLTSPLPSSRPAHLRHFTVGSSYGMSGAFASDDDHSNLGTPRGGGARGGPRGSLVPSSAVGAQSFVAEIITSLNALEEEEEKLLELVKGQRQHQQTEHSHGGGGDDAITLLIKQAFEANHEAMLKSIGTVRQCTTLMCA